MADPGKIIHLSVLSAGLLPLMFLLPAALIVFFATRKKRGRDRTDAPDWSIPTIDAEADRTSLFHRWDPAAKAASLLVCCFLIASLKSLTCSAIALVVSILAVFLTSLPWRGALRRLAAMSGFLVMFLVVMPFSTPTRQGETLLIFPLLENLPFHLRGLLLALTIVCKACAIALLMEPMLGTAPLSSTLQGFARLGIPGPIMQMILLSHRYIFVFQQEILRMHRSMRVRGFTARTDLATLRTMGNFFGMLFISSFDRTQKVYEAMLCRGYQGSFPTFERPVTSAKDVAKGLLCGMIGALLVILDRLFFTLPI